MLKFTLQMLQSQRHAYSIKMPTFGKYIILPADAVVFDSYYVVTSSKLHCR